MCVEKLTGRSSEIENFDFLCETLNFKLLAKKINHSDLWLLICSKIR